MGADQIRRRPSGSTEKTESAEDTPYPCVMFTRPDWIFPFSPLYCSWHTDGQYRGGGGALRVGSRKYKCRCLPAHTPTCTRTDEVSRARRLMTSPICRRALRLRLSPCVGRTQARLALLHLNCLSDVKRLTRRSVLWLCRFLLRLVCIQKDMPISLSPL